MHWRDHPIHVIDFEGSPQSGIVEYGVVSLLAGEITDTHTRLCAPTGQIDAASFAQHGIRSQEAQAYAPFNTEWELFNSLRQSGPFAAHHASVEDHFIRRVWAYPSACPDFTEPQKTCAQWGAWIDSCKLAAYVWSDAPSHKLGELIKWLGLQDALNTWANQYCPETRRKAHCALYDALASALILKTILTSEAWAAVSMKTLIEVSASKMNQNSGNQQISFLNKSEE